jgi:hypothetical protein
MWRWRGITRQDHVHQRRMVVTIRSGDLELHLVARRHRAVTGVVADEQRLLAGAHRPPAGGRVAVAAHDRAHHLAVNRADRGPRHHHALRHRACLVDEPPGLPQERQFGGAFDQAQQPDEIGGVDQFAEAGERSVDHLAALRGEAVGVVFGADPHSATAVIRDHVAQLRGRVCALAVGPDANVFDHRSEAGLPLVG